METNQVNTLLPAAAVAQMPPDVKAKLAAAMQAQERASAPSAPYTSKAAGLLKAMQGGLGGILQNATLQNEMQAQAAHRETLAKLLLSASPGATGTAGGSATPSAATPGAAPGGQGGVGSDHGAGRSAGDYLGRLGEIESGNRDVISNKASGATGRYQFIASTWDRLSKQYPELGLTPDGRTDPAQQQRAIQAFTNDNASALGRSGFQATPGNLYLAHFAGAGGATAALKADPNTPVEQVLGGAAVRANPFLKGKTAGDLVQWANGKMAGVDPSSAPGAAPGQATAVASNTPASSTATASAPGASPAAIGDGVALAAENRLKTGSGTDADRALLASYRQQQNTPAPSSDGTVRGDLLAAAAQHGMHSSAGDVPAADAHPVSMAGLPPGVTPAMFAASQNTATDGNALHRGDEMPAGAPPFTPGAVTASGVPHQLAAGAGARADSGVGAGIGGGPSNTIRPPSGTDAPFDPEGTGSQNYDLSAAPDLRTALVAAMNGQGPNLGKTAPSAVPDPVPANTPDAPPAPSVLPPAQPPSGLGTAGAPVVPEPQGTLVPPPAPAPASDNLRDQLTAAWAQHDPVGAGLAAGKDVALDPVVPDPAGTLVPPAPSSPNAGLAGPQTDAEMGNAAPAGDLPAPVPAALPDAGPMPPLGGQTPQVVADQAAAAAPTLDPEGTGPQNYGADGPTLRDTLTTAMNDGGASVPPAAPGPGPAPAPTQTAAAMPLPSADDPVGGLVGAPGSPAVPATPMAGGGAPNATPGPDKAALIQAMSDYRPASGNADPGSGATLPTSGPMPPNRPQMLASAILGQGGAGLPSTGSRPPAPPAAQPPGLDPDAPAPNAVPTGPAPMQSAPVPVQPGPAPMASAAAPMASAPQPLGLAGDGGGDPSSAHNFLLAEAMRNQGAPAPQRDPRDYLPAMGVAPTAAAPSGGQATPPSAPTGLNAIGGQSGSPLSGIPILGNILGGGQQGGGAPAAAAPPQGQGGAAPAPAMGPGGYPVGSQQAGLYALATDPRTTPEEMQMIMSRLNPAPMKLSAGEGLVGRKADGSYGELYSQASKDQYAFSPDGMHILNKGNGRVTAPDGAMGGFHTLTPQEKETMGLPADGVFQMSPNGQLHTPGGQTINVGGEQNIYDNAMSKTMAENHTGLMQGVEGNRTKLRDLNMMSGALQRLQKNGGTTGMGAEEVKDLQSAINTGSNALGLGQQFDVSDKEVIGKVARQISGAAAKDIGGARTTNFDMQQMLEANPGLALSPTGNQRMIGIAQQVTQRNIDIGQQMQDAEAQAVSLGKRADPRQMEAIRANYDQQHHITDPITGQDLSVSTKLPEFGGKAAGPNLPTPTATPPVLTPDQAKSAAPGTVFMTQDGRRMVRQ